MTPTLTQPVSGTIIIVLAHPHFPLGFDQPDGPRFPRPLQA